LLSVGSHGEGQREGQRQRKEDVWDGVCAIIFIIIIIIIIPWVRCRHHQGLSAEGLGGEGEGIIVTQQWQEQVHWHWH